MRAAFKSHKGEHHETARDFSVLLIYSCNPEHNVWQILEAQSFWWVEGRKGDMNKGRWKEKRRKGKILHIHYGIRINGVI